MNVQIRAIVRTLHRVTVAMLAGLALATVVLWVCDHYVRVGWSNFDANPRRPIAAGIASGKTGRGAYLQWWVDRRRQSNTPDQWFLGIRPAGIGVWYAGTYLPPGLLNLHGVYYIIIAPMWFLSLLFSAYPIALVSRAFIRRRRGRIRAARGSCLHCGYNLTGNVTGRCPECGKDHCMDETGSQDIDGLLIAGKTVRNAARPEWGNGTVLTVKPTTVSGEPVHRVTIQFLLVGHKTLMVPPARLIPRENLVEEETPETWIEQIAGRTPDERLRALPEAVTQVLGTLAQRVAALGPLYEIHETDDLALMRWAKSQSETADPLTHWSKDELHVAFRAFCQNRDDHLRIIIAEAKQSRGPTVVEEALTEVSDPVREAMLEVLRRPI